jgi:glucose/arabinose dehydrogenase
MMTVHKGMKVNLFASEEKFPRLVNPVQSAVGPDGKLYVAVWPSYPHWHPTEELKDAIVTLHDDDGDGVADRLVVFADKIHNPTGFCFWGGGILVASAPDLIFLKDTDGDGVAAVRTTPPTPSSSVPTAHSTTRAASSRCSGSSRRWDGRSATPARASTGSIP